MRTRSKIPVSARRAVLLSLVVPLAVLVGCEAASSPPVIVFDLEGRAVDPFADTSWAELPRTELPRTELPETKAPPETKATVFLFTRTDCPISNRYAPVVNELHTRFSELGVRFARVYPNPHITAEAIERHAADYEYVFPAYRDPDHRLVARAEATITPEAAVFLPDGTLVYRGRVDDRYVDYNRARRAPTRSDLEETLERICRGERPEPRTTPSVGCLIEDLE